MSVRIIDADALTNWIIDELRTKGTFDELNGRQAANLIGQVIDEATTVNCWISVKDRLPVETHSIFWTLHGTAKWSNAMWREQSDEVLVTVIFKDSTRLVTTGETHDGEWLTSISRTLEPIVTHWAEMPEPPKEAGND